MSPHQLRVATLAVIFALLIQLPAIAQSGPGRLLGGPAEGDISLQDSAGHWMLVQGIPVAHQPVTAKSVPVAVIDSGVLPDHPQLKGLIAGTKDFTGEGIRDRIGHGTVMAILLRAAGSMLPSGEPVPSPSIFVAKVAQQDGSIEKSAVIAAIRWAASQQVKIVNLSLGFPQGSDNYTDLCATISHYSKMLFIAAAGNEGKSAVFYPAACGSPNLISVCTPDDYSGHGDVCANGDVRLAPTALGSQVH